LEGGMAAFQMHLVQLTFCLGEHKKKVNPWEWDHLK
jgi:hypothetical protein